MNNNVLLIGFMGSGKTTLGKMLGQELGYDWVDMDHEIEKLTGESIKNIFLKNGEAYFRQIEKELLEKLCKESNTNIISTGGGIVITPANREILRGSLSFYLEWELDTLYKRIKIDPNRPLVKSEQEVKALFRSREAFYEASARYSIHCEGKTEKEILSLIVDKIQKEVSRG